MKPDSFFVLDSAGWPALLVDAAGTIVRANQEAIKKLGSVVEGERPLLSAVWAEGVGPPAEEFLAHWERSPSERVSLKLKIKGGGTAAFSVAICSFTKEGQKFFILQLLQDASSPGTVPPGDSTSALKQKLDCALQLARTVSLDFNNALTGILGHASLMLSQTPANHPWRASLREIEKAAARAGEIANDLGLFSRQEKEPRAQAAGNLNALAQRSVEELQKTRPEKIEWTVQLGRQLYAPKFDEAKMQQAFVKVLENAADAVGPAGNGRVTVQTRNVELAEAAQDRDLRLAAGTYVCAEISDNGCGIPPENLSRVFEPFFTTKKGGQHRGLGLALVYGIVTNHGGGVAVSSQPEAGTSVRIYLPAEKKIARERSFNPAELNGSQTILMVDDEDTLLTMGQTVLSSFGYRVLTANNGQKAMELLARNDPAIDLVITDLVMPSMSGRELAEHIQRIAPRTRVICMSGFVRSPHQESEPSYLQKPFTAQDLVIKVKQALTAEDCGSEAP